MTKFGFRQALFVLCVVTMCASLRAQDRSIGFKSKIIKPSNILAFEVSSLPYNGVRVPVGSAHGVIKGTRFTLFEVANGKAKFLTDLEITEIREGDCWGSVRKKLDLSENTFAVIRATQLDLWSKTPRPRVLISNRSQSSTGQNGWRSWKVDVTQEVFSDDRLTQNYYAKQAWARFLKKDQLLEELIIKKKASIHPSSVSDRLSTVENNRINTQDIWGILNVTDSAFEDMIDGRRGGSNQTVFPWSWES